MAWALVVSTSAGSGDGNNVTTSGVDTTGADTIFIFVAQTGADTSAPTDNKSNTWTALTPQAVAGGARGTWYYAKNATVGSGHTFSLSGFLPSIAAYAFSGGNTTAPFDQETGAQSSFGTTGAPGSLTPASNDELVLQGCASHIDVTYSLSGGYSTPIAISKTANRMGQGSAYLIQTTATATNPTWTWNTSTVGAMRAAAFKSAGGGGGGAKPWFLYASQSVIGGPG